MKKLFIAMLLPALLAGCSSDNVTNPAIDNNQGEKGEPILFCSGLNQTKAVIEGNFLPESALIGIYGLITETTEPAGTFGSSVWTSFTAQTNLNNGKYTALAESAGKQQLKADVVAKFPSDGKSLFFFAYYPHTSDVTDGTIPITIDPAIDKTQDYLYTGAGAETPATALQRNAVNLQFKHAMARMDIKIKKGNDDNLPATATLKKIEVTYAGGSTGTMSLTDGRVAPATADGSSTVTASNLSVPVNDATKTEPVNTNCKFLLFPGGNVTKIVLTMTRSDFEAQGDFEYKIEANTNDIKLEAGKITTITLTYLPNDALLTSNLTPWDTTTENDKGFDAN